MSTLMETNSLTQCIGKQISDGCNGNFPRKDYEGLCAKCLMLESCEDDPMEYERRKCLDCGAAARFFKGEKCGRCQRLYNKETGQEDEAIAGAERAFSASFQARMQAGKEKKKALAATTWTNPLPIRISALSYN
ncbi:hypothetical protein C8R45DRAFT_927399 [Mycena sanguinolenta]|nr:hypothetical protein C8R45DRAFT_927399 [Mycena sanguinolenta]